MSKYARKVDTNQADVIQWYTAFGYDVINTSKMGDGFVDFIAVKRIYYDGVPYWEQIWVEVKADENAEYTPAQKRFNEKYPGLAVRVETVEDVMRSVQDG